MPTLHEIRALSSHLYATAGYEVAAVQELMAHTDPDMTRAYQKGHARKVLRVEMTLPYRVPQPDNAVRERHAAFRVLPRHVFMPFQTALAVSRSLRALRPARTFEPVRGSSWGGA
ncbi:MAG: hypothetical protein ACYCV6_18665, partial [Steroidobacteraceae bacterium]